MKNILKIIIFFFAILSHSQEGVEVPLNSLFFEHPNGTYFKDMDNNFLSYIGVWRGEKHGKELTIELVKFEHHTNTAPNGDYLYEDLLMGKYQVKDVVTGAILSSTMNATSYDDYKMFGLGSASNGEFEFRLVDSVCSNSFAIFLTDIPNAPNQLRYDAIYAEDWDYSNCSYTDRLDIPIPIPFKTVMVLTKQ